jgi:hypothetical protein
VLLQRIKLGPKSFKNIRYGVLFKADCTIGDKQCTHQGFVQEDTGSFNIYAIKAEPKASKKEGGGQTPALKIFVVPQGKDAPMEFAALWLKEGKVTGNLYLQGTTTTTPTVFLLGFPAKPKKAGESLEEAPFEVPVGANLDDDIPW